MNKRISIFIFFLSVFLLPSISSTYPLAVAATDTTNTREKSLLAPEITVTKIMPVFSPAHIGPLAPSQQSTARRRTSRLKKPITNNEKLIVQIERHLLRWFTTAEKTQNIDDLIAHFKDTTINDILYSYLVSLTKPQQKHYFTLFNQMYAYHARRIINIPSVTPTVLLLESALQQFPQSNRSITGNTAAINLFALIGYEKFEASDLTMDPAHGENATAAIRQAALEILRGIIDRVPRQIRPAAFTPELIPVIKTISADPEASFAYLQSLLPDAEKTLIQDQFNQAINISADTQPRRRLAPKTNGIRSGQQSISHSI